MNDIGRIDPEEIEKKRDNPSAEFVQEGLQKYLVFPGDYTDYFFELEYSTIRRNDIPVLLPIQVREKDNQKQVFYDISGKRSLETCAGEEPFSFAQCRQIIDELISMISSLEDHLLEPEFICYDPSCVYSKGQRLFWVYGINPGPEQSLQEELEGFLSFLLSKLDYDDSAAVNFVYKVFWTVRKQGFSGELLEELLLEDAGGSGESDKERNTAGDVSAGDSSRLLSIEEGGLDYDPDDSSYGKDSAQSAHPALSFLLIAVLFIIAAGSLTGAGILIYYGYSAGLTESGAGLLALSLAAAILFLVLCFRRIRKTIMAGHSSGRKDEENPEDERRNPEKFTFRSVKSYNDEDDFLSPGLPESGSGLSEKNTDPDWFRQEDSLYSQRSVHRGGNDDGTIILSKIRRHCPVLKSMEDGSLTMVRELPFYIGSDPILNQMVLIDKTISRQHAVILQGKKNSFRIKDLGSTNGTWIRGVSVNSARPVELEEGCIICFAQKKYRFIIHRDDL